MFKRKDWKARAPIVLNIGENPEALIKSLMMSNRNEGSLVKIGSSIPNGIHIVNGRSKNKIAQSISERRNGLTKDLINLEKIFSDIFVSMTLFPRTKRLEFFFGLYQISMELFIRGRSY